MSNEITPFERIRRVSATGNEFWSSRDFSRVLGYANYRHFLAVVEKARTACFNSSQRVEDHFVGIDEMIEIGKGGQRPVTTVMMSRYACYLVVQNADPAKPIVALGQTYFAFQTRRQELTDQQLETERRLPLRAFAGRRFEQNGGVRRRLQALLKPWRGSPTRKLTSGILNVSQQSGASSALHSSLGRNENLLRQVWGVCIA